MEIIYLIIAQICPEQLFKLVEALDDSNAIFVIHIDSTQLLKLFKAEKRKNIYFVKDRSFTLGGGFKLVQGILSGLRYIYKNFSDTSRVVLLNSQDYPIKSKNFINSYFAANRNKIFIQYFPIQPAKIIFLDISGFTFKKKNKSKIRLYGGSFGMSFSVGTIKIILDFLKTYPSYSTFFKNNESAAGSFFQTLLLNCEELNFTKSIVNKNLILIDRNKQNFGPRILNGQDISLIKKDASLFAGKFDPQLSLDLIMFIDHNILKSDIYLQRENNVVKKSQNIEINKETTILFLTDKWHQGVIENYDKLKRTSTRNRDVYLIYHQTKKKIPRSLKKLAPFVFDNSILNRLGYKAITSTLVPGSNHFPLLKFYLENPRYKYYWYIEDDVRYNGDWEVFFDFFSQASIKSDFLSCIINDNKDQPSWYWWNTIGHPFKRIPQDLKIRSFNPIFRISNRALSFLHEELSKGWCGHHEVLIPTLLKNAGFSVNDLGGIGKYVLPECENKFYIPPSNEEDLDTGTVRFRPFICKEEINERLLYHPVKFKK